LSKTILAVVSVSSLITVFGPTLLEGQTQTLPAFEVASVRPHPINGIRPSLWSPGFQCVPDPHCGVTGNRFREVYVGLADLIVDAYKVKKFQIAGLPGWGDSGVDLFEVEARIPDSVAATPDNARLMLQTLLADRFQLRIHHESRLLPVYALVISKKGLKLIHNEDCSLNPTGARADRRRTDRPLEPPVAWVLHVESLSHFTDRPVIDESGLEGAGYCTPEGMDPGISIMVEGVNRRSTEGWVYPVIEDKWGMKLEPKKAQMDVVVVDKVERPSAN
jgi:uncharacterized protein (TIGR03435 family)